jgi:hypothetical protein
MNVWKKFSPFFEEDLIKCLAPTYIGDFSLPGRQLREKGINRIGKCNFKYRVTRVSFLLIILLSLLICEPLLRIRDVYPGSEFFYPGSGVKKIPDPGSGSASKNLKYFQPKNFLAFGFFPIPDPIFSFPDP